MVWIAQWMVFAYVVLPKKGKIRMPIDAFFCFHSNPATGGVLGLMDGGGGGHNAAKFKTQLCGFAAVSDTTGTVDFFWLTVGSL